MRKMKKFLAVALSAAMVLSVSVPAMAAGEKTDVSAASSEQQAYEAALIKEAEAQQAYDKAESALGAAIELLNEASEKQSDIVWRKPSDGDIKAQKDVVDGLYDQITGYDTEMVTYWTNEKAAKDKAQKNAGSAYQACQNTISSAKTNIENLQKQMKGLDPSTDAYKDLNNQLTEWQTAKTNAEADLPDLEAAYKTAQTEYQTAAEELAAAEAQKAEDTTDLNEARKQYNKLLYLAEMVEKGLTTVKDAENFVKEKQAEYEKALKDLKDAKEARIKAEKRVDEAGQRATELLYDKAVAARDAAKQIVDEREELLADERENLKEIQAEIAAQEALIAAYDDAVVALDNAQAEVEKWALALSAAEAQIPVKEAAWDAAVRGKSYIIPKRVQELQLQLNMALSSINYTDFDAYKNSLANIENIRKQLEEAINEDPELADTVLDVTTYEYNKAVSDWETAAGNWAEAEVAVEKAQNVVNDTFGNYQKAVTALYEYQMVYFSDELKEVYHVTANIDTLAQPINGVYTDNKALVVSPLDRVGGQFVHLDENYVPEMRNGKPRDCTPSNLVVYVNDEFGPTYEVLTQHESVFLVVVNNNVEGDAEESDIAEADNDYEVPMYPIETNDWNGDVLRVTVDGETLPVVKHYIAYGIPATEYGAVPYSLYAQEETSKAKIALLEADVADATKALVKAQAAVDEAAAEYELYHGYKPGEEPAPTPGPIPTNFTDVKADDWFAPYVGDVVAKGIMNGMNSTFFGSYSPLQRQDFCVILYRMYLQAGGEEYKGTANFKDVKATDYFATAVAWAANAGIMKGYAHTDFTVFGVGDNITREDFAVALHRFYNYPSSAQSLDGFKDASNVSLYAKDALKWAVETGAISGKEGGLIDPQAAIVRCEAAKVFSIITDAVAE